MALTQGRKPQLGLVIPIISSAGRREQSLPPTFSPETTRISLTCMLHQSIVDGCE
jgi:hypothetical protein